MYQVSYDNTTHSFNTMGDLLVFINREKDQDGGPAFRPVGNVTVEKNGHPLVFVSNTYGKYGVQQEGSAFDLFLEMLDEVEQLHVKKGAEVLQPYQMKRAAWEAVNVIGSAAYNVYPCFTMDQLQERRKIEDAHGLFDTAALSRFCEAMFIERFGYGHNGPRYDRSGQTNARHEVHVAYALAAGKEVPEAVLEEYRDNSGIRGSYDVGKWFKVLLEVPQLRGKIPAEKLAVLCNILSHNKIQLTVENAPEFIRHMWELPAEPTYVEMDDYLYGKGILPAKYAENSAPAVDLSTAFSPLALHIRQLIGEWRVKNETQRIEEQRKAGNISLREYEMMKMQIARIMETEPLEWANKMARAVEERHLDMLLHVLDTPDDSNTMSKKAIQEHCGLKLLGLKAKDRRNAIFLFCGYDNEKRQQYEQSILDREAQEAKQRASKEAEEYAAQAQWRMTDGSIVSGKEYVDLAVAAGHTIIVATRKGRALQYWLKNPVNGYIRNILAKDGTLAYARLVLGLEEERKAA